MMVLSDVIKLTVNIHSLYSLSATKSSDCALPKLILHSVCGALFMLNFCHDGGERQTNYGEPDVPDFRNFY